MEIQVAATLEEIEGINLENKTIVVIDVLRATTTITTALAHGAAKVIPVLEPKDAFTIKETVDCILGGERKSCVIPGFDCGNSPFEYQNGLAQGKTVVISTTNGTKALHTVSSASRIYLGSLINALAVARKLIEDKQDCIIVCSGTEGDFSSDDYLAAGAILYKAKDFGTYITNDLGDVALNWYETKKDKLYITLASCFHGRRLLKLGLDDDINYCAQEDVVDIVPEYTVKENHIIS